MALISKFSNVFFLFPFLNFHIINQSSRRILLILKLVTQSLRSLSQARELAEMSRLQCHHRHQWIQPIRLLIWPQRPPHWTQLNKPHTHQVINGRKEFINIFLFQIFGKYIKRFGHLIKFWPIYQIFRAYFQIFMDRFQVIHGDY